MDTGYVLLPLFLLLAVIADFSQADADAQHRKDLKQIVYYNSLLQRHRTEMQKIEKINSDIKKTRLKKLQEIIDTPSPHNVSLIATDENFAAIRRHVRPVSHKKVTESLEQFSLLLQGRAKPGRTTDKPFGAVEFQISERDYQKYAKFLTHKALRMGQ